MKGRDGEAVSNRERHCILGYDTIGRDLAQDAPGLAMRVTVANRTEVLVITRALVRVAQPAECLQVVDVSSPPCFLGRMWSTSHSGSQPAREPRDGGPRSRYCNSSSVHRTLR